MTTVLFPTFSGINAYMLPIIIGDNASIPEQYHGYIPLIEECSLPKRLNGELAYLTIKESVLKNGETQVMPGVHLDLKGQGFDHTKKRKLGHGIYMANTVANSCKVWVEILSKNSRYRQIDIKSQDLIYQTLCYKIDEKNIVISLPEKEYKSPSSIPLVDSTGKCNEQIICRILKRPKVLDVNTIYHIHECNPHQSLPIPNETPRQLFRLTVGNILEWREDACTKNPKVKIPSSILIKEKSSHSDGGSGGWDGRSGYSGW